MSEFIPKKMVDDLVEQFKGKKNLGALAEAIDRQMQDVAAFFRQLRDERSVNAAVGAQLEGVGDIVVLTRQEAGKLANLAEPGMELLDDEEYRKYIIYQILRNTCDCTYPDIIRSFRMFWPKPLYYSEDPEYPATMVLQTDTLAPEDMAETLLRAPIIKAAGVGIRLIATTQTDEMRCILSITPYLAKGYTTTILPEIEPEYDFKAEEIVSVVSQNVMQTRLAEIKEVTE